MTSCTYNGQTTTFTYGSDGLRRSMTSNGVTTNYCYDGSMLVREMQAATSGNLQAGQTLGQLYPTCTYFEGVSGPAYRRNDSTGSVRWYLHDGLGSVVGEVDPNGCVTSGGTYDVYGAPRAGTQFGAGSTSQGFVGELGHQTDSSTGGLIYMQARYYDPGTGRFVSQDPKQSGTNWYCYALNNPVCNVDPNGKSAYAIGLACAALWMVLGALGVTVAGIMAILAVVTTALEAVVTGAAMVACIVAAATGLGVVAEIGFAVAVTAAAVIELAAIVAVGALLAALVIGVVVGIDEALNAETHPDANDPLQDA